jgi:hypothetical protein
MKKLITTLALMATVCLQAQISKTDGLPEKVTAGTGIVVGTVTDNNSIYVLRKSEVLEQDQKLVAERYNKKSLAKEWSIEIPSPKGAEFIPNISGYYMGLKGTQLYLFAPIMKSKKIVLILQTLGTDGKISEPAKDFLPINIRHLHVFNHRYADIFKWRFSPDMSKVLLWICDPFGNYWEDSKGTGEKGVVIDLKNLTLIADKLPAKYNDIYFLADNYAISNEGNIACGFRFAPDNDYTKRKAELYCKVGIYVNGNEKVISPKFQTADKIVLEDCAMTFDKSNKLFYSAIVTDDAKQEGQKKNSALYVTQYDISGSKIDFETTRYMSDEWREKYDPAKSSTALSSNGAGKKAGFGAQGGQSSHSSYKIYFNFTNDGSCIISSIKQNGWNRSTKYNCSDDAVISKITATGKVEWVKTVPVSVAVRGGFNRTGITNFLNCAYVNNKMYYVFDNDVADEKNVDLNKVETSKQTETVVDVVDKNINTSCISVDMAGNLQRTVICNNKESGFDPLSKTIFLDKNKILMHMVGNGGKENFSTLTVQ